MKSQAEEPDFLEELIAETATHDPDFPARVEESTQRMLLLGKLERARKSAGITQALVAARMETSTSFVTRLESGRADCRLSTLQRYAAALGMRLTWSLERMEGAASKSAA